MDTGFSDRDLVAMATQDAAAILEWQNVLGSLRPGARADLIVARRLAGRSLRERSSAAKETSLSLVMINGVARFGTTALMTKLAQRGRARHGRRPAAHALPEAGIR